MKETRHSSQREAIYNYLCSTTSHPTAETIHNEIRNVMPNISLGTVYRNLTFLSDSGQIIKLTCSGEPDRFDAQITPHSHFRCNNCKCVSDIFIDESNLDNMVSQSCGHIVRSHDIMFYGICSECSKK